MNRTYGTIGCSLALVAVALGAFGAHALKDTLVEAGMLEVWQTAVDYHIWHALALIVGAMVPGAGKAQAIAAWLFFIGIVLFSGSLYWLALEGPKWLGPITPLGGLSLMSGWVALAVAVWRVKPTTTEP
ncbi:DUF423 domain-containing protein [Coraliomargarita sinensis]|uniref:DUF423 domain-containing protein n=1 Tax=Coraliomargarita sinensis TaxID=2174842 RepID=A0A317ZIJ7_9BACT|nr:DUF423 domain-containing protein [Coraliomargarita sinensis]PXA05435.1 DUF423 domain-containing protein [Coraliomargarita sinensis]